MRGLFLGVSFFVLLPLIFFKGPFIGILMWYWVSLMVPQAIVWDSFFSTLPYALIVAVATLLSWLVFSREPKQPPRDRTTVLLCTLMLWISITSYLGSGPREDIYEEWLIAEKMLLMTVVAYTLTNTRQRVDQLIAVCALSIGVLGLRGGLGVLLTGATVWGPGGMIGANNEIGVAFTLALPLLLYLTQRYRQPHLKWSIRVVIAFTLIADLFTYSRGALLALCALAVMAWLRSRQKLLFACFALVVIAGAWTFAPDQWFARMNTIQTYQSDSSAEQRLYMWRLSWAMALRHPIFGAGLHWSFDLPTVAEELAGSGFHWPFDAPPTTDGEASDNGLPPLTRPRVAHSIWFETVSDHGFPGLAMFLGCFFCIALDTRWLIRSTRNREDLAWADHLGRMLQASLVGYAVGGSFGSMNLYDLFYVLMIIAAAARRVVAHELAAEAGHTKRAVAIGTIPSPRGRLRPQPIG